MTTSQDIAQSTIEEYLNGTDYHVIALKGAWGTGKTHIWTKIEEKWLGDAARDLPAYCSLYGIDSIEAVKKNLFEYVIDSKNSTLKKGTKAVSSIIESAGKLADKFLPGAAAASNLAKSISDLVADSFVSKVLQDRVIVLDDLERRGDKLSVTAALGFIDYLKKQGCRVLVIFNEEKFSKSEGNETLNRFREKAFDIEVSVKISASEAFEIATKDRIAPVPYAEKFRDAFVRTGVDNIRIAKRIASLAERIFTNNRQLDEDLANIAIEATVVLTALYYEGFDGAPKFDDVIDACGPLNLTTAMSDDAEQTAIRKFINDHPFPKDAAFLELLKSHLKTGLSLGEEFIEFWKNATVRRSQITDRTNLIEWLSKARWDHKSSATDLRTQAKKLSRSAELLHFSEAALFAEELKRLNDDDLAALYIKKAVDKLDASGTEEDITYATVLLDERIVLPIEIKDAIDRLRKRTNSSPTLLDALLRSANSSYLHYLPTLESASADDYAHALLYAPYTNLLELIKLYVRFSVKRSGDKELPSFSKAVAMGLRKILDDSHNQRMVDIVTRTLTNLNVDPASLGTDTEARSSQDQEPS